MANLNPISRRALVKSSAFGLLTASIPGIVYAGAMSEVQMDFKPDLPTRYPSLDDAIVSEVVGASHFNLDRVRELVDHRPELARATWDWAFGDFETALGAASHVGRRDIADYLMSQGARPDIFTYAMLGSLDVVRGMIEATPGIQTIAGPHGISLLQHAKNGMRAKDITTAQEEECAALVQYLESLGNADVQEEYLDMTESEQQKYLGDYKYGDGEKDGFSVRLNMRDMLCLGRIGAFGGALYRTGPQTFDYNGAPSVSISFEVTDDRVLSLTVQEPDLMLTARKLPG
jgi:hypothetical protein